VNDSGGAEQQSMTTASLWFSTRKEHERHGEMVKQELDAIKEQLAPIMEGIKKGQVNPENN
jgi:hypothetical protein